jgi:hypothetical protein
VKASEFHGAEPKAVKKKRVKYEFVFSRAGKFPSVATAVVNSTACWCLPFGTHVGPTASNNRRPNLNISKIEVKNFKHFFTERYLNFGGYRLLGTYTYDRNSYDCILISKRNFMTA